MSQPAITDAMPDARQTTTIRCPFCPRLFGSPTALRDHAFSMRRKSATHGLHRGGKRRTRQEIEAAVLAIENGAVSREERPGG